MFLKIEASRGWRTVMLSSALALVLLLAFSAVSFAALSGGKPKAGKAGAAAGGDGAEETMLEEGETGGDTGDGDEAEPGDDDEDEDDGDNGDDGLGRAILAGVVADAFPELGLTAEQVLAYLDSGSGFGEVVIAASLAVASGQTLDSILSMNTSGMGWGEISDSLGLGIRGFGRFVSAVLGGRKTPKPPKPGPGEPLAEEPDEELAEECARTMAQWRFGLGQDAVNGLMLAYGLRAQEILATAAMVRASGQVTRLTEALRIRAETRQWAMVGKALGLDMDKWARARGPSGAGAGDSGGKPEESPSPGRGQGAGGGQGQGQGQQDQGQGGGGQGQGQGQGSGGSGKGSGK